jgi:hypothetical protein
LEDEDATPEEYRRPEALAEDAASVIKKLVRTRKEVRSTTVEEEYAPTTISLWLKPADALAAYERIVADPSRAWLHGEDNHGFLCSSWETPITERLVFPVPGVREATVRCEYYSSPRAARGLLPLISKPENLGPELLRSSLHVAPIERVALLLGDTAAFPQPLSAKSFEASSRSRSRRVSSRAMSHQS